MIINLLYFMPVRYQYDLIFWLSIYNHDYYCHDVIGSLFRLLVSYHGDGWKIMIMIYIYIYIYIYIPTTIFHNDRIISNDNYFLIAISDHPELEINVPRLYEASTKMDITSKSLVSVYPWASTIIRLKQLTVCSHTFWPRYSHFVSVIVNLLDILPR